MRKFTDQLGMLFVPNFSMFHFVNIKRLFNDNFICQLSSLIACYTILNKLLAI